MALTGKTLKADKAKKVGLVDLLVAPLGDGLEPADKNTMEYLEKVAVQVAREIVSGKIKINRQKTALSDKVMAFALDIGWVRNQVFGKAREQVMKLSGGLYPAPLKVNSFYFYIFFLLSWSLMSVKLMNR